MANRKFHHISPQNTTGRAGQSFAAPLSLKVWCAAKIASNLDLLFKMLHETSTANAQKVKRLGISQYVSQLAQDAV
jgi:hypothetical protein